MMTVREALDVMVEYYDGKGTAVEGFHDALGVLVLYTKATLTVSGGLAQVGEFDEWEDLFNSPWYRAMLGSTEPPTT